MTESPTRKITSTSDLASWLLDQFEKGASYCLLAFGAILVAVAYLAEFNWIGLEHDDLNTAEFITANIVGASLMIAGGFIRMVLIRTKMRVRGKLAEGLNDDMKGG